jgi:SAM-dependent methyltransferase
MLTSCPNCNSPSGRPFYGVQGVPCHSVLLMHSREQAVRYPTGNLQLCYCESCSFIFNSLFDVSANDYSPDYEETQHFSPRFNEFCDNLIADLVNRFSVQNKRVLEIGCGKGEFLGRLCETGQNTGIGFDPSCRPERLSLEQNDRIQFVPRLFTESDDTHDADLVCCRHTLEHIQPTREFLLSLRTSIGDRLDTLVFFEVPDIDIILRECRYWDLYYEHCSYFSETSLTWLFQSCGFDVMEVTRAFDDQYLLIYASPASKPLPDSGSLSLDSSRIEQLVKSFEERFHKERDRWQRWFRNQKQSGHTVAVWGAGSKCVSFLTTNGISDEVQAVIDINPHKQGRYLPGSGHRVEAPEYLNRLKPDAVVVMNSIYLQEISSELLRMGLKPEIEAL